MIKSVILAIVIAVCICGAVHHQCATETAKYLNGDVLKDDRGCLFLATSNRLGIVSLRMSPYSPKGCGKTS